MTHIALYVPSVQQLKPKASLSRWTQPDANRIVTRSLLLVIRQQNNVAILIHKMCTQQSTNHLLRLTKSHCRRAGISILIRKLRYRIVPTRPLKRICNPSGFTFTNCFGLSAEFARIQPMQTISCRYQLLFDARSPMNCVSWQDQHHICNNARTKPIVVPRR